MVVHTNHVDKYFRFFHNPVKRIGPDLWPTSLIDGTYLKRVLLPGHISTPIHKRVHEPQQTTTTTSCRIVPNMRPFPNKRPPPFSAFSLLLWFLSQEGFYLKTVFFNDFFAYFCIFLTFLEFQSYISLFFTLIVSYFNRNFIL